VIEIEILIVEERRHKRLELFGFVAVVYNKLLRVEVQATCFLHPLQ